MDYSSIPNDPDHPAGASPWGSTSPRVDRTFPTMGEPPSSPLNSHGTDREGHGSSQNEGAGADQRSSSPDLSERLQGAQLGDPDYVEGPPFAYGNHGYNHGQQQPQSQAPARYQTGTRPQARQNTPKYRLQAKIAGLERVGKKDPVLRFDVHVCLPTLLLKRSLLHFIPCQNQKVFMGANLI